jgi:hypothetical protein
VPNAARDRRIEQLPRGDRVQSGREIDDGVAAAYELAEVVQAQVGVDCANGVPFVDQSPSE